MDLSRITSIPINNLNREYVCDCGKAHKLETEIFFGGGVLSSLPDILARYVSVGSKVFFVIDGNLTESGNFTARSLGRKGYRVNRCVLDNINSDIYDAQKIKPDEDTRMLVSFGGGTAADLTKYTAKLLDLPYIIIALSQASAGYLIPSAALRSKGGFTELFVTDSPLALVCDTMLLPTSAHFNASGFGTLCARFMSLLDCHISRIVTGENSCSNIDNVMLKLLAQSYERITALPVNSLKIPEVIMEQIIRVSALASLRSDSRLVSGGETATCYAAELLLTAQNRLVRLQGETEMLTAAVSAKVAEAFIYGQPQKLLLPPDNNKRLELMSDVFCLDETLSALRIQAYPDFKTLQLNEYRYSEYRNDIAKLFQSINPYIVSGYKHFKRMYDDDGFFLRHYLGTDDLALSLALSPDIFSKYTFLTYLKNVGFLERYIS